MQDRSLSPSRQHLVAASILILGLLSGSSALAESGKPSQAEAFGFPFFNVPWLDRTITVRCDLGQSPSYVLEWLARPGDRLRLAGVCDERIVVTQDRLTLEGIDGGAIDGSDLDLGMGEFNPLVMIDGALGVELRNLSIRNSPAEGVIVRNNASATLSNLTVTGNSGIGVLFDSARGHIDTMSATGNLEGVDSINNSSVVFTGDNDLSGNAFLGLGAAGRSTIELRGAQVNASGNGAIGTVIQGSTLSIFNFAVSQGSGLTADNNGLVGIVVTTGGAIDITAPLPLHNSGINVVSASGNAGTGMLVTGQSRIESPFGAAMFKIENNPIGLQFDTNSSALVVGGMQIFGNTDTGLLADGAGVLTIVSPSADPTQNPSAITDNGTDVSLSFGSRATFGAAVGSIVCDPTALARGSASCPQ